VDILAGPRGFNALLLPDLVSKFSGVHASEGSNLSRKFRSIFAAEFGLKIRLIYVKEIKRIRQHLITCENEVLNPIGSGFPRGRQK